jgi:hypothetical protein
MIGKNTSTELHPTPDFCVFILSLRIGCSLVYGNIAKAYAYICANLCIILSGNDNFGVNLSYEHLNEAAGTNSDTTLGLLLLEPPDNQTVDSSRSFLSVFSL